MFFHASCSNHGFLNSYQLTSVWFYISHCHKKHIRHFLISFWFKKVILMTTVLFVEREQSAVCCPRNKRKMHLDQPENIISANW